MLTIKKDTWHYLLYKASFALLDDEESMPERTTLCPYMWRICAVLPFHVVVISVVTVFAAFCMLVCFILGNVFGPITGIGYCGVSLDHKSIVYWEQFDDLNVRGRRIPPWKIVSSLWAMCILGFTAWAYGPGVATAAAERSDLVELIVSSLLVFAVCCVIARTAIYIDKHGMPKKEKINIFKEYLKARKQKVCPLIQFAD